MLIVVTVNFSVAFEADWYRIIDSIGTAVSFRNDVIRFNLYSAKPMAYAASSVAGGQ
jgi:hypothetical protein